MAVTLCVPPRPGELCAPVRFLVRQDSVVMELTARHRIVSVEWDEREHAVAMVVEITDPQTARPVDVRIDVVERGVAPGAKSDAGSSNARTATIGTVVRGGRQCDVVGTYLGVVADEN
ncbi:hypothetical protein [Mycobacterium shigaense]|uniref:Uncharacterized protein n=1 Tax=Mycobacterium shigaense TaxID=722731 RepID=A0A1Z4EBK8_9MYCO|nr:hypothetical protein [Mycobacterium shigaense]PRI15343.1 hypothetical protein B2J96_13275 [Mycobacterium shigaense]BAX90340.1 hypothetical protein MSG_00174 [Mycobacterium shigaense]